MDISNQRAMVEMLRAALGRAADKETKVDRQIMEVALIGVTLACEFGIDIKRIADALEKQNEMTRHVYSRQGYGDL